MTTYQITMMAPFGIRPKGTLLARMLPLAQALVQRGHQVRIVAPPLHNPADARTCHTYAGVPVIHTAYTRATGAQAAIVYTAWLLRPLLAHLDELVYLFKPKGYGGLAVRLLRALQPHRPVILDTDDWEGFGGWNDVLPYPTSAKMLFHWQELDLPRHAHAITAASHTLLEQLHLRGIAPERSFYLPNGIAAAQLHAPLRPAPDLCQPTLLVYTRFWEFQVDELVQSLVQIVQSRSTVRVLVIGKGEQGQEHDLLVRAQHAGIAAALDYRGWIEPEQIPALLAQATLALVPVDNTLINQARCSAKLIELIAAGVPVVASRVGQMAEYVQIGVNGWLVEPHQPVAFAQAVLHLLDQPHHLQHMRQHGWQTLHAYTWERLAQQAEAACAYAVAHSG